MRRPATFRILSIGDKMYGLEESHHLQLSAVAKKNTDASPYCVANEYICAELAHLIRLPVPPSAIVHASQLDPAYWFASLDFNLAGEELPPIQPRAVVQTLPDLATGVIMFDLWIGNADRHVENLAATLSTRPPRLSVFDHGMALLGGVAGQAAQEMARHRTLPNIPRHCLAPELNTESHREKWQDRIRNVADALILEICEEAMELGITPNESQAASDFLRYRRDRITNLFDANRAEFRNLP